MAERVTLSCSRRTTDAAYTTVMQPCAASARRDGAPLPARRRPQVLAVDPGAAPGDGSCRSELDDPDYAQVVIFDHVTRRRG